MIKELETVVLTRGIPEHGLEAGDLGTVVMVHEQGKAFEVEFVTLPGETLVVATLEASAIRPVDEHEMPHARRVAEA
jgi:hypothetical protein